MGTRHLIVAVKGGQTRLAQYCQWDGYPSGNGVEVLRFIQSKTRLAKLSKALDRVEFLTQDQLDQAYRNLGVTGDFMSNAQAAKFKRQFPLLSRDHSAKVLTMLLTDEQPKLVNQEDFAGDSLFCEWAYVIDYDKQTFEVYQGFNKAALDDGARFAHTRQDDSNYHPVRLIAEWKFSELPTVAKFFETLADRAR